jgi:hypothetical protein
LLSLYANQDIPWKRKIGMKPNGQPLYADPQPVKGRFEYTRRFIRSAQGEKVVSEASVMTRAPVNPDDILVWDGRDWPVLAVAIIYGLMGKELHREVSL